MEIIQMSVGKWMNKIQYTHTMEYYAAMNMSELQIHAT